MPAAVPGIPVNATPVGGGAGQTRQNRLIAINKKGSPDSDSPYIYIS